MSFFLIGFLLLIVLALGMLLPTLLRRVPTDTPSAARTVDARQANLQILREQLTALDLEHANGALGTEAYQVARTEIERRALEEESQTERPESA